jgi:putative methyltransferase (TIGR04325 family)
MANARSEPAPVIPAQRGCRVSTLKNIARALVPPALLGLYRQCRGGGIRFVGHYSSWQAASAASGGYDADSILARVSEASEKVRSGAAVFERDAVLFNTIEHSFPLLAILMKAAAERDGKLNVLDFGGSLGSSYRQCRPFLPGNIDLDWCVVEQQNFVRHGQERFTTDELRFCFSIDECMQQRRPDVVLFASVLQYLEGARQILDAAMDTGADYIMVDRTPMVALNEDWICVQKVPASVYEASYPCAMLSQSLLESDLGRRYELVSIFDALGGTGVIHHGLQQIPFEYKGMIWRKR